MSQQNVTYVIERLLTDDELRTQFALDRFLTIADFHLLGYALTPAEIAAFVQSDLRCWCCETERVPGREH
jgi:hypothetical protein